MPFGTCCCAPATGSATRRRRPRCTRCRCRRRTCGSGRCRCAMPLLALAGPAWELSVDDASRAVCFTRVTTARAPSASPIPRLRHRARRPNPPIPTCPRRPSHDHPAASRRERRRARWLKITAAAWAAAREHPGRGQQRGLSRLSEQSQASAQDAPRAGAQHARRRTRTAGGGLEEPAQARHPTRLRGRPQVAGRTPGTGGAHPGADAHAGDLQALQARMGDLESSHEANRRACRGTGAPPSRPSLLCPNRRSTSWAWSCAAASASCRWRHPRRRRCWTWRLLREGDAVGAWHLLAIEARAAVFRVDGQTQRLALP